jgi:hypothetical protein
MSIYKKLAETRTKLAKMALKKSGRNSFAKFDYYELGDFLPEISELNNEIGLLSIVSFGAEYATMTIIDTESPGQTIQFNSPMVAVDVKGANSIQSIGAMQTYQRRYLYMLAYEITESDTVDATIGAPEKATDKNAKKNPDKKTETLQLEMIKSCDNEVALKALWVDFNAKFNVTKAVITAVSERKKELADAN